MTVSTADDRAKGLRPRYGGLAPLAAVVSALSAAAIVVAALTFGMAYAVGGAEATEDNWVGYLVGSLAVSGLFGSLTGFALGCAALLGHERRALIWVPLTVFPAIVLFLFLGEAFWWE